MFTGCVELVSPDLRERNEFTAVPIQPDWQERRPCCSTEALAELNGPKWMVRLMRPRNPSATSICNAEVYRRAPAGARAGRGRGGAGETVKVCPEYA